MKVDHNNTLTNTDGNRERALAIEEIINLEKKIKKRKRGKLEKIKQHDIEVYYG